MSECRMLSKKVTEDDNFIGLPAACQLLYVHLVMGADDDGFNNQTNMAKYKSHATDEDLKTLAANKFIIMFENSNVILIKHWRISNRLRKDGYVGTTFKDLFAQVYIKPNGAYTLRKEEGFISAPLFISKWLEKAKSVTEVLQSCNDSVTTPLQNRNESVTKPLRVRNETVTQEQEQEQEKNKNKKREEQEKKRDIVPSDDGLLPFEPSPDELEENLREAEAPKPKKSKKPEALKLTFGEFSNVFLTEEQLDKLKVRYGTQTTEDAIEKLSVYIQGHHKEKAYKDHYAVILDWVINAVTKEHPPNKTKSKQSNFFEEVSAWAAQDQNSQPYS